MDSGKKENIDLSMTRSLSVGTTTVNNC